MRQIAIVILVAVFISGPIAGLLLGRIMTNAPEWLWNFFIWISIVAGIAILLLYEPIWARLRDGQASPVVSTLVVQLQQPLFSAVGGGLSGLNPRVQVLTI